MIRRALAVALWTAPLGFIGCEGLDCAEVRRIICERACQCELCQFNFPGAGSFVLSGVDDCVIVLAENACTDDTPSEDLDACVAAVEASPEGCPYEVPNACTVESAFNTE